MQPVRPVLVLLAALVVSAFLIEPGSSPRDAAAVPVVDPTSCTVPNSCFNLGENAVIGPNSCNAIGSCDFLEGTVGEGSCNDDFACNSASGDIGDGSCSDFSACENTTGDIGDGSCNGDTACRMSQADIGNASCNGVFACFVAEADIGDGSCNGDFVCDIQGTPIEDCEQNSVNVPPCNVMLAKGASSTVIPSAGGTPVTFTVRIDFLEDEGLSSIEDDQFPGLDPATHCELFDSTDISQGAVNLPDTFISGDYIVCQYSYAPPAGTAGSQHVNIVTINVGAALQQGPAAQIIGPGEDEGTWDVSEEVALLYAGLEEDAEPEQEFVPDPDPSQFPRLGGTPLPLPTATPIPPVPAATQPVGAVGAISPPATGDGGLR